MIFVCITIVFFFSLKWYELLICITTLLVGAANDEFHNTNHGELNKKKRTREELENKPADVESTGPFARFLIIQSFNSEHPLSKLSPCEREGTCIFGRFSEVCQKTEEWPIICRNKENCECTTSIWVIFICDQIKYNEIG